MDGSTPHADVLLPQFPALRTLRFEGRADACVMEWIVRQARRGSLELVHLWIPGNEFEKHLTYHALDMLAPMPGSVELHVCCDMLDVPFSALPLLQGLVSLRCRCVGRGGVVDHRFLYCAFFTHGNVFHTHTAIQACTRVMSTTLSTRRHCKHLNYMGKQCAMKDMR